MQAIKTADLAVQTDSQAVVDKEVQFNYLIPMSGVCMSYVMKCSVN